MRSVPSRFRLASSERPIALRLLPVTDRLPLGIGALGVFGGDHEIVPVCLDELAEQGFGFAKLIAVGRIEEIAAGLDIAIEQTPRLVAVGAVAPSCPEHAGAQGKLRDAQTSVPTEDFVPHDSLQPCASSDWRLDRRPDASWRHRHVDMHYAKWRERIEHGVNHARRGRNGAAFADG